MPRPKPEIIYENTVSAVFVQRNNCFTAEVAAAKAGVEIIYNSCHVEADSIKITGGTLDTSRYRNAK